MEKKQSTTRKNNKKKIFGNTALQLNDVDASCMVGGIVEKGYSDKPVLGPVAPPRPSVLHFPAARHRSEGPHWSPVNSKMDGEEGEGDSEDDEAVMDFDVVKPYAKPIVRKSKKDMNFSKRVEMEVDENRTSTVRETMRTSVRKNSSNQLRHRTKPVLANLKNEQESVLDNNDMEIDVIPKSPAVDIREEQVPVLLESEIDAENRARLQGMSTEEIAQAQDEIMGRLDPALLQVLKRRGEEKLKKERTSSSDKKDRKPYPSSHTAMPHVTAVNTSNHTWTDGLVPISGQAKGKLWNAWSERVEAVRGLRFSSDGTVVGNSLQQMPQVNLAGRDYLRTEGDPGAAGYTIKEAVSLTRSLIAGQRDLALALLSNVLNKALQNIHQNHVQITRQDANKVDRSVDWEAIWAYALGPEPELVLALRMCLDDNHKSVVRMCAKVIYYVLSCDVNENFFDVSEKLAPIHKDTFTAPVFRSKPEIDVGFLHGGFWKYNAKPSNVLALDEDIIDDEIEGKRTIQDDIVVAGQDFAAGLVRMGILPALCYLLESDPTAALEEYILSILIAIARHSPKCANAIMICERLLQTVVSRFIAKDNIEIQPSKIKSVRLLKVLAQSDRKRCFDFIKNGSFQTLTWHLYQPASFLDNWVKSGKEKCRLSSALMVEQLRFWKVCIQHGYCVSYFSEIFPYLCLWLNPPMLEKLIENGVLCEFASISKEAYLVLEALARRLPNLFAQKHHRNQISEDSGDDADFWSWSHVGPMVEIALKWIVWKNDPSVCKLFDREERISGHLVSQDLSVTSLLWVYSAVLHMLSRVLERVIPDDTVHLHESSSLVPWLPEFVPKVGLEIIKNGFVGIYSNAGCSFIEKLCNLRQQGDYETSLATVCCLHGLLGIIINIDKLITLARASVQTLPQNNTSSREEKILKDGILKGSLVELRSAKNMFVKLVASEWHLVQSIEKFGRGGPAPGVGVGWGASGGGYWSGTVLLAQADARFLTDLIETLKIVPDYDIHTEEEMMFIILAINSSLGVCVTAGPTDGTFVKKAINSLLDVSVLKYLDICIRRFLSSRGAKLFNWDDKEEDYLLLSRTLASHFSNRWLSVKKKLEDSDSKNISYSKSHKKGKSSLNTIYEDIDTSGITSQDLVVEWAHQRLPLPVCWFLSPVSTLCDGKTAGLKKSSKLQDLMQDPGDFLVVARAGLFFLLGIEALASFLPAGIHSPVKSVPLVWKLHSLSVLLLVGMGVLEEEKSRVSYEALQDLYGNLLHQARSRTLSSEPRNKNNLEILAFESEIHGTYSTFIETLVEQFSAVSYGDLIYGRQVAVYLHRCVEAPVRLAAWNTLTNSRVLELLPPLENCFTDAEGYLEPVEDNSDNLLAYVKSWTSGALDRAASRGSLAYTLVLHHLSAFIFESYTGDKLLLRNKLSRSLLQDFSSKQHHEAMMLTLIQYSKPSASQTIKQEDGAPAGTAIVKRLELLIEACEGSSSLLNAVERLKSSLKISQL
ncbi:putative RNA polymerase II-associated protein [Rosa chinensis]|uniref:Putative RNA polymerase II-associated protein n=1 Tax=Rosa chinensis TaxID=74649 RepID=A0A2P6PSZ3_ROSCH|nr:transcriptional elongation regulator MINIYO [Rosa chinensis]PRQ25053.1 putative RNA polymerase II-associated protein [Rosa chinensis]